MNDWTYKLYLRQVLRQAEIALAGFADLERELARVNPDHATVFGAAQSMVSASAIVSKMIKPPGPRRSKGEGDEDFNRRRDWAKARGERLRSDLIASSDVGMEVLHSRDVRDSFEHFDERMDEMLSTGYSIWVDDAIGPLLGFVVVDGAPPQYVRRINQRSLVLWVFDRSIPLRKLAAALHTLADRARTRLRELDNSPRQIW